MPLRQDVLKSKKDFVLVLKKGTSKTSRFLALKTITRESNVNRLGILASARVFKKASLRNKIKRRLREAFRRAAADLKPGNDMLLIARPGLEKQKFSSVEEMTKSLFRTAGLWRSK